MATDATGSPTPLGIPTLNPAVDAPTGNGENAMMNAIDALITAANTAAAAANSNANTKIPLSAVAAAGDILYATGNSTITRLAAGSTGQQLTVSGGLPVWASTAGFSGGIYSQYTPLISASVTNPANFFDTTNIAYTQVGKIVHYYGQVLWTAGFSVGSGTYWISLPVLAASRQVTAAIVGSGYLHDASSGNAMAVSLGLVSNALIQMDFPTTYGGVDQAVTDSQPWVWAAGDFIRWNTTYEAA